MTRQSNIFTKLLIVYAFLIAPFALGTDFPFEEIVQSKQAQNRESFHNTEVLQTAIGTMQSSHVSSFSFSLQSLRLESANKETWMNNHTTVQLSSISISLAPPIDGNDISTTYYAVLVDKSNNSILSVDHSGFQQDSGKIDLNFNTDICTSGSYDVYFVSDKPKNHWDPNAISSYDKLLQSLEQSPIGNGAVWDNELKLDEYLAPTLDSTNYYNDWLHPELAKDKDLIINNNTNVAPIVEVTIRHNPEPSAALLSIIGLLGMVLRRRAPQF